MTNTKKIDKEIFGPVLQVIRVPDWGTALYEANNTNFGLAAGLISNNKDLWETFHNNVRAGIVNFNRPTTGAASFLPFGGPGFRATITLGLITLQTFVRGQWLAKYQINHQY